MLSKDLFCFEERVVYWLFSAGFALGPQMADNHKEQKRGTESKLFCCKPVFVNVFI